MDPLSAIVAVIGVVLAGGLSALLTARSTARKVHAEADRTTIETFSTEWQSLVDRLKDSLALADAHNRECQATLAAAMTAITELRAAAVEAREMAVALKERVGAIETGQPAQTRHVVSEVVRKLGGHDADDPEGGGDDMASTEDRDDSSGGSEGSGSVG